MPWTAAQAKTKDKKATGKKGRQWSKIADKVLAKTGDEGLAIREASGAVKKAKSSKRKK